MAVLAIVLAVYLVTPIAGKGKRGGAMFFVTLIVANLG
jgi:hypothetical protein